MVEITNAVVSVSPVSGATNAAGAIENPEEGAPISVTCFFEPLTPAEAYKDFGVVLSAPAVIMAELADASFFAPDSVVDVAIDSVSQGTYVVQGIVESHQADDEADHIEVYLNRLQYPNGL